MRRPCGMPLPGRFSLIHMADYDPTANFGESSRPGRIVPVGEGMIDGSIVMEAALMSDIAEHGFNVEMESEQLWEDVETSLENLRSMEL